MAETPVPIDIGQLVQEHHAAVYRYAFRLTGNAADAEDLVQQVFLTAQEKLDQIRQPDRARSWLYTVLRRSFLRGRQRRQPELAANLELQMEHVPDEFREPEIDREALQAALNELPSEFRIVVVMFYFEFCSYKEIAAKLELPMGTVMSRLSRAKSFLRARLSSEPTASAPGRD